MIKREHTMQGFWGTLAKYLVFLTNFLVFVGGCVFLGFGIYALVQDSHSDLGAIVEKAGLADGGENDQTAVSKTPEIVLVAISGVIIVLSFLGCCGAFKENRFSIFLYFTILLLITVATVVGATLVTSKSVQDIESPIISSLARYNGNATSEEAIKITASWDHIQDTYSCCGVTSFTDWTNLTLGPTHFPDPKGNRVPASCCTGLPSSMEVADCQKRPYLRLYSNRLHGCFTEFKNYIDNHGQTLKLVADVIIGIMLVNLILLFAFALCLVPKDIGYQSV